MRSQNPQKKFLRSFCLTKKKCNCAEYMFDLLRYYIQAISIFLLQPLRNFLLGEKITLQENYTVNIVQIVELLVYSIYLCYIKKLRLEVGF